MAHFQLPHSTMFPGGTRLLVNSSTEKLVMHKGNTFTLELTGWPKNSGKPTITASTANIVSLTEAVKAGNKWRFTVKAEGTGTTILAAKDTAGNTLTPAPGLNVIAGEFKNHPSMTERDLIADVFRKSDPAKMHHLSRMLHNDPENKFNENSTANVKRWGALACGTVAKVGGRDIINPKTDYEDKRGGKTFHQPIKKDTKREQLKREDLLYETGIVKKVAKAIQKRLKAGMPVLVSLVYNIASVPLVGGKLLTTKSGNHTVLIVGCNTAADSFLYIDVYPDGSVMKYEGGPTGLNAFPLKCRYLGVFHIHLDPVRNIEVLRTHKDTQGPGPFAGDQYLEIIYGPVS